MNARSIGRTLSEPAWWRYSSKWKRFQVRIFFIFVSSIFLFWRIVLCAYTFRHWCRVESIFTANFPLAKLFSLHPRPMRVAEHFLAAICRIDNGRLSFLVIGKLVRDWQRSIADNKRDPNDNPRVRLSEVFAWKWRITRVLNGERNTKKASEWGLSLDMFGAYPHIAIFALMTVRGFACESISNSKANHSSWLCNVFALKWSSRASDKLFNALCTQKTKTNFDNFIDLPLLIALAIDKSIGWVNKCVLNWNVFTLCQFPIDTTPFAKRLRCRRRVDVRKVKGTLLVTFQYLLVCSSFVVWNLSTVMNNWGNWNWLVLPDLDFIFAQWIQLVPTEFEATNSSRISSGADWSVFSTQSDRARFEFMDMALTSTNFFMALFINKSTTKKILSECVSISNYKSSPACRATKWDEHSSNLRGWYWCCCCYFFMKHVLLISINSNLKNCCGNSHQFSFHSLRDMNQFQLRSSRRLIDSLGVMNLWWTNALQKRDMTKGETANATCYAKQTKSPIGISEKIAIESWMKKMQMRT